MEAQVIEWSNLPVDKPIPLLDRKRINGEHVMIAQVTLYKGCHVATHHHENEQFAWCTSGKVRFGIGAEGSSERYDVVLTAGQVLHLPSNVPHSADALEDTTITDLFSPVSEGTGIDRQGH